MAEIQGAGMRKCLHWSSYNHASTLEV